MNNNNTFTNVILVVVLVLIVGFGVWFFTSGSTPMPAPTGEQGGINVNIEGTMPGNDDGTPDQGSGDR